MRQLSQREKARLLTNGRYFLQFSAPLKRIHYRAGKKYLKIHKGAKTFMLSTLLALYKLLGAGNFVKVLLILLKGIFA